MRCSQGRVPPRRPGWLSAAAPRQVGLVSHRQPAPRARRRSSAAQEAPWREPRAGAAPRGSFRALLCLAGSGQCRAGSRAGSRAGRSSTPPRSGQGSLRPSAAGPDWHRWERSCARPGVPAGHEWSLSPKGGREAPGGRPCYETGAFICGLINQG